MTDATDFAVGDQVELIGDRSRSYPRVGNAYGSLDVQPGQTLVITRLYNTEMVVRGPILRTGGGHMVDASVQAYRRDFRLVDSNRSPARRLGRKPEDTEDMTYIGIDHPGIQWLFDDMGRYATQQGYCPQYDALCVKLGIPGRPRPFDVHSTIGGIEVSARIEARSQREANERFRAALLEKGPSPEPDSEPTPPNPDFPLAA